MKNISGVYHAPHNAGAQVIGSAAAESMLSVYPDLAKIIDRSWQEAIRNATHHRFEARTIVMRGASRTNQFFLLLAGSVRVYHTAQDGREITLYHVHPGDLCILSLNGLLGSKRSLDVIVQASTDVYALGISEADFRAVLATSEAFRTYVLSALNERLCDLMCLVQDTAFQNLSVRLACLLGRLFEREKSNTLQVTHQELAQELGAAREVISRLLKEFEQQGHIHLSRGRITVSEHCRFLGLGQKN